MKLDANYYLGIGCGFTIAKQTTGCKCWDISFIVPFFYVNINIPTKKK